MTSARAVFLRRFVRRIAVDVEIDKAIENDLRAVLESDLDERVLARQAGMKVVAVSLMTNFAAGLTHDKLGHEQTLAVAREASGNVRRLLHAFLEGYR